MNSMLRMDHFAALYKGNVAQSIEFVKILDILCDQPDSIPFYKRCRSKIHDEFNPFDPETIAALEDLAPQTFNRLLVDALHLQKSMIEVALLEYQRLNLNKYRNQLKAFNFNTIWNQRQQIWGEEAHIPMSTMRPLATNKTSPSPSLSCAHLNTMMMSPPLIRTPPSPPKMHNECYSPVAPRYRMRPTFTRNASDHSLLEGAPPTTPHRNNNRNRNQSVTASSCTAPGDVPTDDDDNVLDSDMIDEAIASVKFDLALKEMQQQPGNPGDVDVDAENLEKDLSEAAMDAMMSLVNLMIFDHSFFYAVYF